MSDRKVWYIIGGVGTLAACAIGGLIYWQQGRIVDLRTNVSDLDTNIKTSRKLVEGTPGLEREVIVLREVSEVMREVLPDEEDANNLFRTFQQFLEESSVEIRGLKEKNTSSGRNTGAFDRLVYTVSLSGETFQLLDFLNRVENHARFMRVPNLRLTAARRDQNKPGLASKHQVQLDIETFKYEPTADASLVKIEGFERKRDLLMGEINRRRQALTVTNYTYRGARGRRDPWIDPRVPIEGQGESALTVQEQMDIVEELVESASKLEAIWKNLDDAENVIVELTARSELETALTAIEDDIRRLSAEGAVAYLPSQRRLQFEVVQVVEDIRSRLNSETGPIGPSQNELNQILTSMLNHMHERQYELVLDPFHTIESRLELVEDDPLRRPIVESMRHTAHLASTVLAFDRISLEIGGVAIMEGYPPMAIVNDDIVGVGDLVRDSGDELLVHSIDEQRIEFIYRDVILARLF